MTTNASGLASPNVPTRMRVAHCAAASAGSSEARRARIAIVLLQRDAPACGQAAPRYASAFCRAERCGRPGAWPGSGPLRVVWAAPATRGSFAGACAASRALARALRRPTPGIVVAGVFRGVAEPSMSTLPYILSCGRRRLARRPPRPELLREAKGKKINKKKRQPQKKEQHPKTLPAAAPRLPT